MINIPVSYGELIDKITILQIKEHHINDPLKLDNIKREHGLLKSIWNNLIASSDESKDLNYMSIALANINERIWFVEDAIREHERKQEFDEQFINLARSIYTLNDERANIKKRINTLMGSYITEEKSYTNYKK